MTPHKDDQFDIVVIGAGIVGLATARELTVRRPGARIAVLDKEVQPGLHQSGHNSGVLHAGVYYAPGSLKARLCVTGKERMIQFAQEHGIAHEFCGKLIVATDESELGRLDDLHARGQANGVPGLEVVDRGGITEHEPHAAGIRALWSPQTGIIDFSAVVRALLADIVQRGVTPFFGHRVTAISSRAEGELVTTNQSQILARVVVSCAGLQSDRVAALQSPPPVRIVPFRGDYYTLAAHARHLCRGLIYPVPDPSLPFLGVHFTKRFDGAVWAGPNAVLALKREGYRRSDISVRDTLGALGAPGFAQMARTMWKTGAAEMWRDVVKGAFVKDLQRYVPAVTAGDLHFGPSGVRAQAIATSGDLVDDFVVTTAGSSVHVLNAPSPAATASLAIADLIADKVEESTVP